MSKPLRLSVVTPVYNSTPEHLRELAVSLADAVGNMSIEWLLVNDGSSHTDTLDCLYELAKEPHVRLEQNKRTQGAAGARNTGASIASVPLLVFLDSDDLLEPGSLEKLTDLMEQNPSVRWLAGAFEQFSEQRPRQELIEKQGCTTAAVLEHLPDAANRLVCETFFNQGSYVVDRKLFWEAGGFDEGFRIGEDWLLWMRMAARGELYYCPMTVLWQRRGHQSVMSGHLSNTAAIVAPYLNARKDPIFAEQKKLLRWRIFRLYRLLSQRNQTLGRRMSTIRYAWLAAIWAVNEPREWANVLRALTGSDRR